MGLLADVDRLLVMLGRAVGSGRVSAVESLGVAAGAEALGGAAGGAGTQLQLVLGQLGALISRRRDMFVVDIF